MFEATEEEKEVPKTVPTLVELKRILPKTCFQPSVCKSLYYVFKDCVIITTLYVANLLVEQNSSYNYKYAKYFVLPFYWYLQGTMFWAVFVLGHDCGHGSFSNYELLNNIIGNLLHGFIMVPYYPWKLSHKHHHKNTGNIDKEEIFYPIREKNCEVENKNIDDHRHKLLPLFGLGFGWFYYLIKGYPPRYISHINPWGNSIFVKNTMACLLSIICCGTMLMTMLAVYANFGLTFGQFTIHYIVPLFVFATWLVVTTFLHHQDEGVPWYSDNKWDFVRGQLSSVDLHYGWAHDLVHNIGTHQIHHLFSKIPHYHLEEATAVFRKNYPQLVRKNDRPILPDFVKMFSIFNAQQWISDTTEIHVYREKKKDK